MFELVVLFLASFVLINTIMQNILEQKHEIFILKALGMYNNEIKKIFIYESFILGVAGSILGIIFGLLLNYYFSKYGISYKSASEATELPMTM